MAIAFHGHLHTSSVESLDTTRARYRYHLSYDSLPNDNFTSSSASTFDLSTRDSLELSRVRLGYPQIPEFEFQTPKKRNREAFIRRQSVTHTNLGDRLNTLEGWTEIIHSMEGQRSELETRHIARSQKPVTGRSRTETVEADLSFPLVLMDHTECMGCTDMIPKSLSLETACGHVYCYTCVENLISQSLAGQESNFPPRCCPDSTPIALDRIENRIDAQLMSRIRDKTEEYSIPRAKRVYCPNGGCSVFLGSRKTLRRKNKTSKRTPSSSPDLHLPSNANWKQGRISVLDATKPSIFTLSSVTADPNANGDRGNRVRARYRYLVPPPSGKLDVKARVRFSYDS
ncbi:hypothetical protein PQX77_017676 [Marasmius sp. AFHP31]|nr:hypothetical protein PQX77_017676 [Marasmius sp. AFHP31]